MPSQPDQGENGQSLPLPRWWPSSWSSRPIRQRTGRLRERGCSACSTRENCTRPWITARAGRPIPCFRLRRRRVGRRSPSRRAPAGEPRRLLHRSDDGGFEWQALSAVPAADIVDLAILGDLSLVLLTASGRIYRSVDLGVSFRTLLIDRSARFVRLARTGAGSSPSLTDHSWRRAATAARPGLPRLRHALRHRCRLRAGPERLRDRGGWDDPSQRGRGRGVDAADGSRQHRLGRARQRRGNARGRFA